MTGDRAPDDVTIISEEIGKGQIAVITEIQRFSVHDGPGIRTLIFFKGCPLRCKWCQNPETYSRLPQTMYTQSECIACGRCVQACPVHAVSVRDNVLMTQWDKCIACGKCAEVCPPKARRIVGEKKTLAEVMKLVLRDRVFYINSGGGVTLSGGEVTMQAAFAVRLLKALREEGIHTAIETCGFAKPEIFDRVAQAADLVLFDVKHSEPHRHRFFTGADNLLIHENLRRTVRSGKPVLARYPLIPGVNDDEGTINETGDVCLKLGIDTVHILPFHQAGETKWDGIGEEYSFKGLKGMAVKDAESAKAILEAKGLTVSLGGSGK